MAEPLLVDGHAVSWPADAWPLPLAHVDGEWRLAAADWTTAQAGFGPTAAAPITPDGIVALAEWDTPTWDAAIGDPALVGFTLITHSGPTLHDADVVLNVGRFVFSDTVDPRAFHRPTTLRHELGHVLGLGHAAAIGPLMHPAQEPGAEGQVSPVDLQALAEVTTCCARYRRPDPDAIDPEDLVWAHGDGVVVIEHGPDQPPVLPPDTDRVEIWTPSGQGGLFMVERDMAVTPPAPAMDPPPPSTADPDCRLRPGSARGQWWILPVLLCWRRRT